MAKQPDYQLLGQRLRTARVAKAFSRAYLSELSGVETYTIEHYERGRRVANIRSLWQLCEHLGTTVSDLTDGI